ncbi:MAG: hypothetical protein LBF64_04415 [Oscillospiraceae bacterium]|nr:hypothetical protein [Oscillospiraceae bacterium]
MGCGLRVQLTLGVPYRNNLYSARVDLEAYRQSESRAMFVTAVYRTVRTVV